MCRAVMNLSGISEKGDRITSVSRICIVTVLRISRILSQEAVVLCVVRTRSPERQGYSFIASFTSASVCAATTRARREPSRMISVILCGLRQVPIFVPAWAQGRRGGVSGALFCRQRSRCRRAGIPHSHDSHHSLGANIWLSAKRGQTSGLPGSCLRIRAGSVTICITFLVISSGLSER